MLTGEEQNLAFPGQLGKISQGGFHTAVIKGDQGIVQHQRCLLLLGQYQITDGQPHRQIQLVCGSLAQLEGLPRGVEIDPAVYTVAELRKALSALKGGKASC